MDTLPSNFIILCTSLETTFTSQPKKICRVEIQAWQIADAWRAEARADCDSFKFPIYHSFLFYIGKPDYKQTKHLL
jgi:hypothetical protein